MSIVKLMPPPCDDLHPLYLEPDDRPESRADSVLEYYSGLSTDQDSSPSSTIKHTGLDAEYQTKENVNYRHNRLSGSYIYDEIALDSRYEATRKGKQSALPRSTVNSQVADPHLQSHQLQPASNHSDNHFGKSSSVSRIPVYKEPDFLLNTSDTTAKRQRSLHRVQEGSPSLEGNLQSSQPITSTIPRSASMPMSQLSQPYKYTASSGKLGSLPCRSSSIRSINRRSGSVAISPDDLEVRDYRNSKEEQARRLQAINQAPSGRPPWIGKFQPDPRLPAEQQMIPTVARKLALERWIEEGGAEESFDDMWRHDESVTALEAKRKSLIALETSSISLEKQSRLAKPIEEAIVSSPDSSQGLVVLGQSPRRQPSTSGTMTNFSRRSIQNSSAHSSPDVRIAVDNGITDDAGYKPQVIQTNKEEPDNQPVVAPAQINSEHVTEKVVQAKASQRHRQLENEKSVRSGDRETVLAPSGEAKKKSVLLCCAIM